MDITDEVLDLTLMARNEGLDVVRVEELGTLGLWQDEVGEGEETDPAVERDPADDEESPRFNKEEQ